MSVPGGLETNEAAENAPQHDEAHEHDPAFEHMHASRVERAALSQEVEAAQAQAEAQATLEDAGLDEDTAQQVATAETHAEVERVAERAARNTSNVTWGERIGAALRNLVRSLGEGLEALADAFDRLIHPNRYREDSRSRREGEGRPDQANTPNADLETPPEYHQTDPDIPNESNVNLSSVLDIANDFGFARYSMESVEGNGNRPALIVVPRNYDPTKLSVVCHGIGGNRGLGEGSRGEGRLRSMLQAASNGNCITIIPMAYDGAPDGVEPGEEAGRGREGGAAMRRGYDDKWFTSGVGESFPNFIQQMIASDSLRSLNLDIQELVIQGFSAGGAALRNIAREYGDYLATNYRITFRYLDAIYDPSWIDPAYEVVANSNGRAQLDVFVGTEEPIAESRHLEGRDGVNYNIYDGDHGDSIEYSTVA